MRYKAEIGKRINKPDWYINWCEKVIEYTPAEKNQDKTNNYTKDKTYYLVFCKSGG